VEVGVGFFASKKDAKLEASPASMRADNITTKAQGVYKELIAKRPNILDTKVEILEGIIDENNLTVLEALPSEAVKAQVRTYIREHPKTIVFELRQDELEDLLDEVVGDINGYGPIGPLLKDPTVTDILINTHKKCYVERFGQLQLTKVHFKDESHLLRVINKIVSGVGRRIDESSPMVDARLPDGSRVNVAIRPVAVDGPVVSIRKFAERAFNMDRLVEVGALRAEMVEVLAAAVAGKVSAIVSGGTGSGKTTLLNALSNYIPANERLITIEDVAELQLQQPHVVRLETRPPNLRGKGEINQRDLVRNALRMRPDRIIIGECRGAEAFDMLTAMNTGHEGSLTTIHANSPRDALRRLEQMVAMAAVPLTPGAIRTQIASALKLVIQVQRLPDGSRRVASVSEITGTESDIIQMQEIFKFTKDFTDKDGVLHGTFAATGIRPKFLTDLKPYGIDLPSSYFDPMRKL
jgi:pilus assembly protein CpaF